MTYLVDTDWVADWLNGRSRIVEELSRLRREGPFISIITYGEVYEGIYFGRNPQQAERAFRQFLRGADVLLPNRQVMQRFARMRGELRRQGNLIPDADLLIAATALHHGLILLTNNVSHFSRIEGLELYR